MAKFQLGQDERLIGSGPMANQERVASLLPRNYSGKIYVTSKRVCFHTSLIGVTMDLPLEEIKGFSVGRYMLLFTQVTIHSRGGKSYPFTGFPAKKLQGWLEQAGVKRL